ncbi:hypothetical protein OESDEN_12035 [Oesophagostomum dentatum]|uniref:SAYSvFN domain-containing protein n=1 Tax=Oesophagostomum dentatum TaxID=61180 RepID=A0A0B1STC3_OESDE|nr:hypothetical protein OESDEN_12035 [Oesophagostomum dentatum]
MGVNVISIRLKAALLEAYLRLRQENNRRSRRSPGIWQRLNIDVLDAPPFRTWRKCYETNPRSTLAVTFLIYLLGQIYFIWVQFGLVFFAAAILITICLGLGNRSEGEMSAYSVFNPNCERLLGQMTAEHFERDVLRRRID